MTAEPSHVNAFRDPRDGVITVPPADGPISVAESPRYGRRASALGAVAGTAIAAVPGGVGLVVNDVGWLILLSAFGMPSAAILGWTLASRALHGSRGDAIRLSIGMGIGAYILGVVLFTVATVVWTMAGERDDLAVVIGPVAALGFGLLFASPSLVITIPSAAIWITIVRRLASVVLPPSAATG